MGWHERATAAHVIVETSLGITMADPLWVALFRSPPWPGLISISLATAGSAMTRQVDTFVNSPMETAEGYPPKVRMARPRGYSDGKSLHNVANRRAGRRMMPCSRSKRCH